MHRVADKATDCARARRILLCDFGEKGKEPECGACRRSEPNATKCGCIKPARACGAHYERSVRLERLFTADWLPRKLQEKMC